MDTSDSKSALVILKNNWSSILSLFSWHNMDELSRCVLIDSINHSFLAKPKQEGTFFFPFHMLFFSFRRILPIWITVYSEFSRLKIALVCTEGKKFARLNFFLKFQERIVMFGNTLTLLKLLRNKVSLNRARLLLKGTILSRIEFEVKIIFGWLFRDDIMGSCQHKIGRYKHSCPFSNCWSISDPKEENSDMAVGMEGHLFIWNWLELFSAEMSSFAKA